MEEKMFCVKKSKKLFPCSTFVLFITAVDKKTSESKNEENNETYTVLGKMNQVMAENDFNDYGRNFWKSCCRRCCLVVSFVRTAAAVKRMFGE